MTPVSLQSGFVLETRMLIEEADGVQRYIAFRADRHTCTLASQLESGLVHRQGSIPRQAYPENRFPPAETSMKDFDISVSDLQF